MIPSSEATIGPFFPPRYVDQGANDLTMYEGRQAKGEVIEIHGRVLQEDGTAPQRRDSFISMGIEGAC